jgi:hypothetical protein
MVAGSAAAAAKKIHHQATKNTKKEDTSFGVVGLGFIRTTLRLVVTARQCFFVNLVPWWWINVLWKKKQNVCPAVACLTDKSFLVLFLEKGLLPS